MIKKWIRAFFAKLKKAEIIMLHHVSEGETYSPCIISTERLIDFLSKNEKYLSLEELLSVSAQKYHGSQVITIDDGLYDLYTVAYPLLTEKRIPFTAFISVDLLDKEGYITTAQLQEMARNPLVTIGSHGCTHRWLDELLEEEQRYEIIESKQKLEALIKKEVKYFAYSNGRCDKKIKKMAKKAGYKRALGVRPRVYNRVSKYYRYELPRINVTNETYKP